MITENDIQKNVELAANDWAGIAHLKSDHLRGIRLMAMNTHGLCAACGESLNNGGDINVCHIVSDGRNGKGIAPNNVYVGHKECNDYDREVCSGNPFLIVSSMARPDLVISSVPSRRDALAFVQSHDAGDKARRWQARDAARLAG